MPKFHTCDNCGNTYYSRKYVKYRHRERCVNSKHGKYKKRQLQYKIPKNEMFSCDQCGKQFSKERSLKLHKRNCLRTYICKICMKDIGSSKLLGTHEKKCGFEKQNYPCEFCSKSFSSSEGLYDHNKLDFYEKEDQDDTLVYKFSCKVCDFSCKYREEFSNHYRDSDQKLKLECIEGGFKITLDLSEKGEHKVKDRNGYWCDECGEKFARQKYLLYHKREVHDYGGKELLQKCPKCDFTSKVSGEILNHFKSTHINEPVKIFKCEICCKSYKTRSILISHQKRYHFSNKKTWYDCEVCENRFDSSPALKDHTKKVHLGIYPKNIHQTSTCEICSMTLKTVALATHIKSSHSENHQMFHCNICDYKVSSECRLKYHQARKHISDKPFECTQCSYRAAHKVILTQHFNYKHQRKEKVTCTFCKMTFLGKISLRTHTKRYHSDIKPVKRFQCNLCEFTTELKINLEYHKNNRHFKLSENKCDTCGRTFRMKTSLDRHIKVIHEKDKQNEIKCNSCEFSTIHRSSLNRHTKSHHNPKDSITTKCHICNISLKTKSSLKMHLKRIHEDKSLTCTNCEYSTNFKAELLKHFQKKHIEQ